MAPRPRYAVAMKRVLVCLLLAACNGSPAPNDPGGNNSGGGGNNGGGGMSTPGGPTLLSFGSNATTLDEKSTLVISAVVSHPTRLDELAGGVLTNDSGNIQYGAFAVQAAKGAYEIRLGWQDIHQAERIQFSQSQTRKFKATFFDNQGRSVSDMKTITLRCSSGAACNGTCTRDLAALHDCGLIDFKSGMTVQSCDSVCTAAGMVCGPTFDQPPISDPDFREGQIAVYYDPNAGIDQARQSLSSCAQLPPATMQALPFAWVQCCCYAK
jgi:hypothetical protein